MIRELVIRGLVAGLVAGVCAGAIGLLVGEGQIDRAIAVESSIGASAPAAAAGEHAHGAGDAGRVEVARPVQRAGLVVATSLYGLALGGLVGLAFAALRGRTAHRTERRLALALVASLFVAVVAVPLLKYPANPPGVGDPRTIGYRTELYLALVGGSLAALLAAWRGARLIAPRRSRLRLVTGAAGFCALSAILIGALPAVDEVSAAYPTGLLHDLRFDSAVLQLTLWSVLGISFAWLLGGRRPAALPPPSP
jgi:hypothetical protein